MAPPAALSAQRLMFAATAKRTGAEQFVGGPALELDTQQRMDLVFTVGAYDLLAMAFLSFGVELDDDLKRKET